MNRWKSTLESKSMSPLDRLKARSTIDENECWNITTNGVYGSFSINGIQHMAHRASWILHFGEIPQGMVVRHACDNPSCVNPKHLSTGTQADNVKDMFERKRDGRSMWKKFVEQRVEGS